MAGYTRRRYGGGAALLASIAEALRVLAALALPAITTTLGLQLLRVFIPSIYYYVGEVRGVSTMNLGLLAILVLSLAFLAAAVRRWLGQRLALAITVGGVGLLRLVEQFVPVPAAALFLSAAGVVLFLWFVPIYLAQVSARGPHATVRYAQAILLGLALDAGIQGAAGTVDLAWQPGVGPAVVVLLLAGLQLLAVRAICREPAPAESDGPLAATLPLIGLGPFLGLQAMLLGNSAAWAALTGWQAPGALAAVLASYAIALAVAAFLVPLVRRRRWLLLLGSAGLLAGLVLVAPLPQRSALAVLWLVACQVLATCGLIVIFAGLGERAGRTGLWRTALAHGVGILLFVLLAFLYFASYWIHLPFESSIVLPAAAVLFGLCVAGSSFTRPQYAERLPGMRSLALPWEPRSAPAWVAAALLILPLGLAIAQPAPTPVAGVGWPVRVMTYNVHHGFNTEGRLDLEAMARNVELAGAGVVGLQEVTRGWYLDGSTDIVYWLSQRLGMPYVYYEAVDPYFGNAILSRLPIKEAGHGALPRTAWEMRRSYVWARLDVGAGEELLFVTSHTHHVYPGEGEIRMSQMAALASFWNQRPRTVIVGDLNARPGDPEIRLFATAGLQDTFLRAGSGEGFTSESDTPHQRIDYIWASPDLKAGDFRIIQSTASDHLPVSVSLRQ